MPKHDYTKDDIRQMAKDEDVQFLRLMFTDLFGTIKNVEVPISQLEKLLDNKLMFDGSSIDGFVRIEESDMYLYPDLSTWMIFPWSSDRGKIARVICEVYTPDKKPFAGDPRNNLIRVLNDMREAGFTDFNIGPEPEFFLFKMDENGKPTTKLNDNGSYFDMAPMDLGENCVVKSFWPWKIWALMLKLRTTKLHLVNMKSTLSMRTPYKPLITFKPSS